MDYYLTLKMIHLLAAVVVAGTGTGIAFFMFMASRSNNAQAIAVTARHVILADWLFTFPAVVVQFITGMMLMNLLNYTYSSLWFMTVIALFVFIGACWLPVIYLQYRLKHQADQALASGVLGPGFKTTMRWWTALGIPAFSAVLVLFWLMLFKPLPVT